jgi:hypothetical protein
LILGRHNEDISRGSWVEPQSVAFADLRETMDVQCGRFTAIIAQYDPALMLFRCRVYDMVELIHFRDFRGHYEVFLLSSLEPQVQVEGLPAPSGGAFSAIDVINSP